MLAGLSARCTVNTALCQKKSAAGYLDDIANENEESFGVDLKRFELNLREARTGSMLAARHERFSALRPIILLRAYGQRLEAFGVDFLDWWLVVK